MTKTTIKKILLLIIPILIVSSGCYTPHPGEIQLHIKEIETPIKANLAQKDEYHISPYDVLEIEVFGHPELSIDQVLVRDDGSITLPKIGKVKIAGLKLGEAEDLITQKLKVILKQPSVNIIPVKIVGTRYYVIGAVANPGGYPLLNPISILDAISLAGGTTSEASFYRWFLIRNKKVIPLDPSNLTALKQIYVMNGDTIVVSKSTDMRVVVLGAVNKPGVYTLETAHPTIWEVIAQAGGFRNDALRSQIGILSWGNRKVKIRVISQFYPTIKNLKNIFIEPGDIIYVPTHPIGEWNRIISMLQPTLSMFLVQPFGVVRDYYMIRDLQKK